MNDAERIADLVDQLVNGWHERIEYKERIIMHVSECGVRGLRYKACMCPETIEARARTVRQTALLAQLAMHNEALISGSAGRGGSKPGSRIPGDITALDLLAQIRDVATQLRSFMWAVDGKIRYPYRGNESTARILTGIAAEAQSVQRNSPSSTRHVVSELRKCIRDARMLLGYDAPSRRLRDMVCGACGATLKVAADASSDVWCSSPDCGTVYLQSQWADMLAS